MHRFCSNLICTLVAFFVITGMTLGATDDCHSEKVKSSQHGKVPAPSSGCHCMCAHGHPGLPFAAHPVTIFQAGVLEVWTPSVEAPPESVPVGIDYPPQLA